MIHEAINKLLNCSDLDNIETKEVFDEIVNGLAGDILCASFVTALKSKGETIDEISNAIVSSRESINEFNFVSDYENLIENTVLSDINDNYFDVSLGCDLICAANNLNVYKYFYPNQLNKKSQDTLAALGIEINSQLDYKDIFEKCGFIYFNLSAACPYFKYTLEVSRNLKFDNILSVINKMLNPMKAKNQVIGLNNKDKVEKFANICLNLKNSNSIVLSSGENFPYISLNGETYVAEAWKNKIFTYILTPELLDIKQTSDKELICENKEHRAHSLIEIIKSKQKNAYYDFLVINSALCLYITKKAASLVDGINLAKQTIESNLAFEKFEQIKNTFKR